ncbi:STP1 protein, partial [Plasmodium ovale]
MAAHLGYTTNTRDIPIGVFLAMIESGIKKLIHTYGDKNCGLRHEELCEEIKKIISANKKIVFQYMDPPGKKKWNSEWDSQRNGFFNKLFDEEGFINMCYPKNYKSNPSLYQLKSRHIQFCKEKDKRRSALGKSPEYNACKEYNMWINGKTTSFTREFLQNVSDYTIQTVKKYFITKENPKGHDPLGTYRNSKLNCNLYISPSRNHQQKPVEKASPDNPHPPRAPNIGKESQGKDGISAPGVDGGTEQKKFNVKKSLQSEPPASDSLTSSLSKTKVHSTANDQHTNIKDKGTDSQVNAQVPTGQDTEATDAKTPSSQQLPESQPPISPKDSSAATFTNPASSVVKDQYTDPNVTLSTTSGTSGVTHSTQNLPSFSAPDLSLAQPQPQSPPVDPGAANNSKEPTPPDSVIKSTDQGASLTFTSVPGLSPSKAEASSVSRTSSTIGSPTTDSIAGSPPAQDPLLITVLPQSTTTTSIVTTSINTQTTTAESGPSTTTVSAIGTQSIASISENTSTIEEGKKEKASLKTKSDTQDSISVSPNEHNDSIVPSIGAQSPGPPAYQPVDSPHGPQLPAPPSTAIKLPTLSPGVSPDVSPASHTFVTRPGTTLISSTPLHNVTHPSEKPSIAPTEFPPLINIIPTTLILLATLTILFLLYKYTPFGLFLGRRRIKKKDLRTVFEIPEESTYESPDRTIHEWDDHLGGQIMENDVYVKLLKMNRYKKEMQKKKKKRDTTLIEVHMEILEECKNDEWELHKGDFLEICLQEFVNEKNRTAENWRNAELTVNNIKNDKIIQDAEENEILWNFWMGNYRNILESWKSEEWFQNLKNEWKKERQKNHNKIEENTLKESGMISIECEKDIWKKWISKQATLIEMFKQEDWFKSLIAEQD